MNTLSPAFGLTIPALSPIAILLVLLVVLRWTTLLSALTGMLVAAVVAMLFYQASSGHVLIEALKGLWNAISIIIVIFPAVLIFELSRTTGAFPAIRRGLTDLIPDRLLRVLALGWCFSSFLQGASGFGVPIAVTAPLLIAIGMKPLWAVVIPLLGHAWGTTFGTLALAWFALIQQVDLSAGQWQGVALWASLFLMLANTLGGVFIAFFYGGLAALLHGLPAIVVFALLMGGGEMLLAAKLPSLAVVIPTTLALGASLLLGRMQRYAGVRHGHSPIMLEAKTLGDCPSVTLSQAMLPYFALTLISLTVLLVPAIKNPLAAIASTGFAFPEATTGLGFVSQGSPNYSPIVWLTHSGFFLLLSALLAGAYYLWRGLLTASEAQKVLERTWHKALPPSLSVILLIGMSKIMAGSGQTEILASSVANLAGNGYGFLAPLVGVLGSFMSSSNVSSNILFGQFQFSAADLTGFRNTVILAAQTAGGALGCMFAPSNVLLGATTAGVIGQEGAIIRKTAKMAVICAICIGFLVMLFGKI